MEIVHQSQMFDDAFVDFDSWCPDMTSSQFYAEDGIFSKQGTTVQMIKSEPKFASHMENYKQLSYLSVNTTDACVPEFESNTRTLSHSSSEEMQILNVHCLQKGSWETQFSKNVMIAVHNEDSISQLSSVVPNIVDENETFQDLTELLEQEYSLSKSSSPPHNIISDFHPALDARPSSSAASPLTPRSEDSQSSLIGSFSADLSYESSSTPKKGVEVRYKEMRRKNNIASKNARVARREKERQMEERAKQLEEDNQALRVKVRRMEELAQELKARLIQSVTRNK